MSAHLLARGTALLLVAAALTACSSSSDGGATQQASTTRSAQPTPSPSVTTPDAGTIARASAAGGVVTLAPPGTEAGADGTVHVESVPDGDTGRIATITLMEPTAAWLAFDVGAAVDIASDGTAAVVTPEGGLALGLTAPEAVDPSGARVAAEWAAGTEQPRLALTLPDDASYPVAVTVHLGASVVATTAWGNNEGGESLAVTPSAWGRVSGAVGATFGWANVVQLEPAADTAVMERQFDCHFLGAKDKATWNLEPWRPDVSFVEYALARCNPT